jgi:hypothetical protein
MPKAKLRAAKFGLVAAVDPTDPTKGVPNSVILIGHNLIAGSTSPTHVIITTSKYTFEGDVVFVTAVGAKQRALAIVRANVPLPVAKKHRGFAGAGTDQVTVTVQNPPNTDDAAVDLDDVYAP